MQDVGAEYSCIYTSPSSVVGLNVTIQVLGPYSEGNKVELLYDLASDTTKTTFGTPLTADYRRAREDTPFIVSLNAPERLSSPADRRTSRLSQYYGV